MPPTDPTPETEPDSRTELMPDPGWKVVLYNDDVTPFDVVIHALVRAAGLSGEVAEAVALEAHSTGSAVVRRGLQEAEAQVMCGRLHRYSRIDGVCPGVHCEALRDA
ncbi:MAG: ATP-dependent Clp protease adaptor ClpS [Planctomycetota bacterium]